MTKFFKKRWHSIPIGIISAVMLVVLLAGSVFAAYGFLSFTTEISVDEPLAVEYNLWSKYSGDSEWHSLGDDNSLTLERSAGDSFVMSLRITNNADNDLIVDTEMSCDPVGGLKWFTFSGFPNGGSYSNGTTRIDNVTIDIAGDTPAAPLAPTNYNITFTFTRD